MSTVIGNSIIKKVTNVTNFIIYTKGISCFYPNTLYYYYIIM